MYIYKYDNTLQYIYIYTYVYDIISIYLSLLAEESGPGSAIFAGERKRGEAPGSSRWDRWEMNSLGVSLIPSPVHTKHTLKRNHGFLSGIPTFHWDHLGGVKKIGGWDYFRQFSGRKSHDISIWRFPWSWGYPLIAGWFIVENPNLKLGWFWDTPIYGNLHLYFETLIIKL